MKESSTMKRAAAVIGAVGMVLAGLAAFSAPANADTTSPAPATPTAVWQN